MHLNQLDPYSDVDTDFHRKAEVFTAHCIFAESFDPDYITQQLSGIRAALIELGCIGDKTELYCPAVRDYIDNYKKMLEENMYPDDGLFHDDQRIETFRAVLEDMRTFMYAHPRYAKQAPILEAMQLLQCGLSLRPSEGLVTNTSGLESSDTVDTSFDASLEDFAAFEDAGGRPRAKKRRAFLAMHCCGIFGHDEGDAVYVNFCELGLWSNPLCLPLLGIQARGRVKNDPKGNRGQRSYGANPDPTDPFCLAKPVVALLRRYPPKRGSTIWSGLPLADQGTGHKYYRLLGNLMRDYAKSKGLDFRRFNLHCNRLYGPQQLAWLPEETRGDQGGWTLRAEHAGAKGAQVYYRLHFWNHAMKVRKEMHTRYTPLNHLDRHIQGIAPSLARTEKRKLRADTVKRLTSSS